MAVVRIGGVPHHAAQSHPSMRLEVFAALARDGGFPYEEVEGGLL